MTLQRGLPTILEPALGRVRVLDSRHLSTDERCETWAVEVEERRLLGRGARHELVVRIDRTDVDGSPAVREARVVRVVRAGGGPVPLVMAESGPSGPLGRSCWVSSHFTHATDATRLHDSPVFTPARAGFVGDCGRALALVHSVDSAPLRSILASAGDPLDTLARLEGIGATAGAHHLIQERYTEIWSWLRGHRLADRPQVLIHGDVRPAHLLVDTGGLVAIIGWGRAHLGDPAADLGQMCMPRWRHGAEPAVAGLGTRELLLAAYRAESGVTIPLEDLQWWEAVHTLVAVSQVDDPALVHQELAGLGLGPR